MKTMQLEFSFSEREQLFKERTGKDFIFFYEKYYPKLLYYTKNMCISSKIDTAKAEDVSTESFIVAFQKIDKYEREKAQFSTWLFTIAKNLMLQEIKNDQKTLSMDVEVDEEGTTMKDFLQDEESQEHLHDLTKMKADIILQRIEELKEPYKTVIKMREIQKMSYQDIADKLDRNLSTIKSQIRNGRAILINDTSKEFAVLDEMFK